MFDNLMDMDGYGSRFVIAAAAVAVGLLLLFVVLWFMRNRASSPFVRGGRNRQPRLQVLDAAAVDARRRLVLVRRDDVEHLIMIGGPTDIVIESRIYQQNEAAPSPEPIPAPARIPEKIQPVMIAEAEPVTAPSKPNVAIARSLAEIEPPAPEPAPIDVRPEPPARPAAAPMVAERERAPRPAPFTEPSPAPTVDVPAQTQSFRPSDLVSSAAPIEADMAADILDSARQRVLQQPRIEPPALTPPPRTNAPVPAQPAAVAFEGGAPTLTPPVQPSDFQRILEEEMTSTLAADRLAQAYVQPNRPAPAPSNLPRRDPEMAPITGADAALQNEVARIFGEMSINRDK